MQAQGITEELVRRFGRAARVFAAPGRVNLIGEFTDYNDGFVLPAALELTTRVAIAPRGDRTLRIHSLRMEETAEFDLDEPAPRPRKDWSDYVRGVAVMLASAGHRLVGADLLIESDVPVGSGLSSSAALEVATGFALLRIAGIEVDRTPLALLCQKAENEFVGMRCGIMDQFIACHGARGRALLIDCRSLESRLVPIDAKARLVICNTMVHHELARSEYNLRRQDCERGVALLAARLPGIRALRDVTPAQLAANAALLPEPTIRRIRHVVGENERTQRTADGLAAGDLALVGRLMGESHRSLRDDFEVSCAELDLMVDLAMRQKGVFGSRMTGGGFGGCTVSLVEAGAVEAFRAGVAPAYRAATGHDPAIFVCSPGAGAGEIAA